MFSFNPLQDARLLERNGESKIHPFVSGKGSVTKWAEGGLDIFCYPLSVFLNSVRLCIVSQILVLSSVCYCKTVSQMLKSTLTTISCFTDAFHVS